MGPIPETDNALPPGRSPDGDLAFAFFGSIAVGLMTLVIPCLLFGLPLGFSIVGAFLGIVWGFLTVIVAAAAECETRRTTTLRMFAILSLSMVAFNCAMLGWPYLAFFF